MLGAVKETCVTVHRKVCVVLFVPSLAVTVTVYGLLASALEAIVPEIKPEMPLTLKPLGNPLAE